MSHNQEHKQQKPGIIRAKDIKTKQDLIKLLDPNIFPTILKISQKHVKNEELDFLIPAIGELTNPDEILQFGLELVEWMRFHGNTQDVRDNPQEAAAADLGYMLGYFDNETQMEWTGLFPQVFTGLKAALDKYNWKKQEEMLLKIYKQFNNKNNRKMEEK